MTRADKPEQEVFFDEELIVAEFWAWRLEFRFLMNDDPEEWSAWLPDINQPNYFRTEDGAKATKFHRENLALRKIQLGVLEYRITPKYIGCVPDKDEAWIA